MAEHIGIPSSEKAIISGPASELRPQRGPRLVHDASEVHAPPDIAGVRGRSARHHRGEIVQQRGVSVVRGTGAPERSEAVLAEDRVLDHRRLHGQAQAERRGAGDAAFVFKQQLPQVFDRGARRGRW